VVSHVDDEPATWLDARADEMADLVMALVAIDTENPPGRRLRESKAQHVLVGAANDPSALGAARAFQEAGRAATCAVVGQNAEPDARAELREPRTPLIASVGYFPEKYGDGLIRLALDILAGKAQPIGRATAPAK